VIAEETTTQNALITGYVVPLAAISAVAAFIGQVFVGQSLPFVGTVRLPIVTALVSAVLAVVMAVVLVYVLAAIITALAPTFNTEKNKTQAFKVAIYSITPVWVAGILNIIPALGILAILAGLYGIYLMYLGLLRVMKTPDDKAVAYTAVVTICCLVVMFVVGLVTAAITGIGAYSAGRVAGLGGSPAATAKVDPNSPLGKLESFGKAMDESAKKMEAAQKSGDPNAQATAALEGLGTLFGGGKRVDPIAIDQLKPFVPDTFGGMPKTSSSAERTGLAGRSSAPTSTVESASRSTGAAARQDSSTVAMPAVKIRIISTSAVAVSATPRSSRRAARAEAAWPPTSPSTAGIPMAAAVVVVVPGLGPINR